MSYTKCPCCSKDIKDSFFASNNIGDPEKAKLIRDFTDKKAEAYCDGCGPNLYSQATKTALQERRTLTEQFKGILKEMPVISIESPSGWEYEVLDIVTAQNVSGTGLLSELSAEFNDLFGTRSNTLSRKLAKGEELCMAELRIKAIRMGANAILGSDVDYAEVSSFKGMLMVCVAGTAVKLKNVEAVFSKQKAERLIEMTRITERIDEIDTYKIEEYYNNPHGGGN